MSQLNHFIISTDTNNLGNCEAFKISLNLQRKAKLEFGNEIRKIFSLRLSSSARGFSLSAHEEESCRYFLLRGAGRRARLLRRLEVTGSDIQRIPRRHRRGLSGDNVLINKKRKERTYQISVLIISAVQLQHQSSYTACTIPEAALIRQDYSTANIKETA